MLQCWNRKGDKSCSKQLQDKGHEGKFWVEMNEGLKDVMESAHDGWILLYCDILGGEFFGNRPSFSGFLVLHKISMLANLC